MWALVFLILLCFFGAAHYQRLYKQQKTARKLHGEALSVQEYYGWHGNAGVRYYELIVAAEGKHYKIRTANPKAKRYRKRRDVVILVPEIEPVLMQFTESKSWQREAARDPEGAARTAEALRQTDEKIFWDDTPGQPTHVIIQEDRKSAWQIWFLWIAGGCFSLLLILLVIAELMEP